MTKYTRDEIIEAAKKVAAEVDEPLSFPDFVRLSGITRYHIERAFPEGSWSEVKRLAELERHPMDKGRLSDDELLREFHRVVSKLGRIPTWVVFAAHANVADSTVSVRFGGRRGTLKRYQRWLEENEPTSPLLKQLLTKSGHKTLSPAPRSAKNSISAKRVRAKGVNLQAGSAYVDFVRLSELRAIKSEKFDLAKLIRLCEELNKCYVDESYFAVAMLVRAILDHVPPIFECESFPQVVSSYSEGTKSFKQSMEHLQNSSRKIADAHLHSHIRKKEVLANKTQVNFASDLDVLLAEIVRALK